MIASSVLASVLTIAAIAGPPPTRAEPVIDTVHGVGYRYDG